MTHKDLPLQDTLTLTFSEVSERTGLSPDTLRYCEIVEALLHSAVYCGMPKALNATFVTKKVFTARGLLPVKMS